MKTTGSFRTYFLNALLFGLAVLLGLNAQADECLKKSTDEQLLREIATRLSSSTSSGKSSERPSYGDMNRASMIALYSNISSRCK